MKGYEKPVKACRSVCMRARLGCERFMKKFGFEWPDHMRCELFPEYGAVGGEVCMDPRDADPKTSNRNNNNNNQKKPTISTNGKQQKQSKKTTTTTSTDLLKMELFEQQQATTKCKWPLISSSSQEEIISTGGIEHCAQPCKSMFFAEDWEQTFTNYWLLVWTLLCMVSTVCTTCTFLIEPSRFKYPEKPIVYLSICYLFVSAGYLTRLLVGHERMACDADGSIRYDFFSV